MAKRAFTLVEVLITLGIIGVVAAMTIPNLIAGYEKKSTLSQLQKVYTSLNQAFKFSELDNGESTHWDMSADKYNATTYFVKYWKPYLKILHICDTYGKCGYQTNRPFIRANGATDPIDIVLRQWRETVVLQDGAIISGFTALGLDSSPNEEENVRTETEIGLFLIDINGARKPNKFGRDVFFLVRVNGKGILTYGYNDSETTINNDCSKSGMGYKCATKLLRDNWEIKEDYPW